MPYKNKAKQRRYQREWQQERRIAWFAQHGPCKLCGSWIRLVAHHRDSGEKISHRIWSWSEVRRLAELAKCDVLCGKCHSKIHQGLARHGTHHMYSRNGCRCRTCRDGNAARLRAYRAKKKAADPNYRRKGARQ